MFILAPGIIRIVKPMGMGKVKHVSPVTFLPCGDFVFVRLMGLLNQPE